MFKIYGTFQGNTELIDEVETKEEAYELQTEYLIAFGQNWKIWIDGEKEYGRIY